jgi:hypothetical protein
MAENKTKASIADPKAYIDAIPDEGRRQDCAALMAMMIKATRQRPVMWGASIVGFGVFKYPLAGGKQGEICTVGFSSRKADISVYGIARAKGAGTLLGKLGKHKLGKGCLYIGRLSDIDIKVLERLVVDAFKPKKGV